MLNMISRPMKITAIHLAERDDDSIYTAGCSNGWDTLNGGCQSLHSQLCSCSSKSTKEVEYHEAVLTDDPFDSHPEYIERVHVEEQMPEASVHEHVGERLPYLEPGGLGIEKRKNREHEIRIDLGRQIDDHIDYDQMDGYREFSSFFLIVRH